MSPGKEEKAKGEEKVILSFIHPLMSEMVISKNNVNYAMYVQGGINELCLGVYGSCILMNVLPRWL